MTGEREDALMALVGKYAMVRSVQEVFYCFGVVTEVDPAKDEIVIEPASGRPVRYLARMVKVAPVGEFV